MPSPPSTQIPLSGAQIQTTGRLGCGLHLAPLRARKHSSSLVVLRRPSSPLVAPLPPAAFVKFQNNLQAAIWISDTTSSDVA